MQNVEYRNGILNKHLFQCTANLVDDTLLPKGTLSLGKQLSLKSQFQPTYHLVLWIQIVSIVSGDQVFQFYQVLWIPKQGKN